ncbi:hypothetical protein GCM10009544_03890 [Streptomyces stramineus]|uniref:Uncharacterized protein n=1 Tax=Streptomyces stramineus TaxID=173861 RepID=A0ABN0ZDL8_9ACTN
MAAARELAKQTGPPREQGVPLPTVEQSSAMDLVTAGDEVAGRWRRAPEEAAALLRKLAASSPQTGLSTRRSTPQC